MTEKESFLKDFDKEKYLKDTQELRDAMIDLISGYSVAQVKIAIENTVFFLCAFDKADPDEIKQRLNEFSEKINCMKAFLDKPIIDK